MISEEALAKLSYPEAPKMVTDGFPGPKAQKISEEVAKYASPTRVTTPVPLVLDEALGATIKDPDGNIFIDLSGAVGVCATGRTHPRVVEAIMKQSPRLGHPGSYATSSFLEFAKKIANTMPDGLRNNCFSVTTQSGGAAVETAIKYARSITKKTQIVAFEGAYHGVWAHSLALTTSPQWRGGYGPFIAGVFHMPYAYCYRCFADLKYPECNIACAKYFDYKINTPGTGVDDVAAVIIEPRQGEGGYVFPPPGFLKMIKEACDKKGILFIVDEIQSGPGHTGKMWAIEYDEVVPDMLIWGKGIGGDQPMCGVTIRADLRDKLRPASQANTFNENAISCAVASANIDIIMDTDMGLMERATKLGEEIKNKLTEAAKESKVMGEVRGKALMFAVELVKAKHTREPVSIDKIVSMRKKGWERGVVLVPCGRYANILRFMPPLVITRAHLNKAMDITLDIIKESEPELVM